jgi:sn-glycerol 3-phosphate transport system permease protein
MEEQGQEEMEKRAKRAKISKNIIQPILYMLPAILIFGIFIVYPICYNIYLSFYDWNMVADKEFVGGKNYASYLTSTEFLQALLNTVGYIVILLIFCFALPYGIAYILGHVVEKGSRFYRAILFFPSLLSLAVAAIVFMWLLNSVNGPVALMLGKVGLTSPNWFQTPKYVIIAIGIMVAWRSFGYNLILYLGAIVDVPGELIEAARLENTSNWKIFTRIIIPLTSPTALFVFILTVSYSLQYVVTPINMLTAGGPNNASTCLSYQIYQFAFRYFMSGKAAAAAIVTLGLFMVIVVWEKHLEKKVHYEN